MLSVSPLNTVIQICLYIKIGFKKGIVCIEKEFYFITEFQVKCIPLEVLRVVHGPFNRLFCNVNSNASRTALMISTVARFAVLIFFN